MGDFQKTSPVSLLRKPYTSLLRSARAHAAFTRADVEPYLVELKGRGPVLDPMSGYGSVMDVFSREGIASVSMEICVPLYLWQVLRNPNHTSIFILLIDELLNCEKRWPEATKRAEVSDEWFVPDALGILRGLLGLASSFADKKHPCGELKPEVLAIALLLPFCGRLSCYTDCKNPVSVKSGGIVVYTGWKDDFGNYLRRLRSHLTQIPRTNGIEHEQILGDCRTGRFEDRCFKALLTSPPYPNRTDYHKMFEPEIVLCDSVGIPEIKPFPQKYYIGSTATKKPPQQRSELSIVNEFLTYVWSASSTKDKIYDDRVYYYPYFANYFFDLHQAYKNIARYLDSNFVGFIIVQNNYFRKKCVPISEAILEMWKGFGFKAYVVRTEEVFHTGTFNPRARGIKAKQLRYTIKVTK